MRNLCYIIFVLFSVLLTQCGGKNTETSEALPDTVSYSYPDTLRVGTLYSPTSYFIYRGDRMGYEYELISQFAYDKHLPMKIVVADNMASMVAMLDSGKVDILAYSIPITAEYKSRVRYCGIENITNQVLIQRVTSKSKPLTDVTQLVGKDIYVESGSKFEARIHNLDNEIGGGINIHSINSDTLITEDLIEMVSTGKLPYTLADNDIAKLNRTYYSNIDISLNVSFAQRSSWAVGRDNASLCDSINAWSAQSSIKATNKILLRRYFEESKITESHMVSSVIGKGHISQYDDLFKRYAKEIGWDWRVLAAQAYNESRFDNTVVSWAGARGIMQLMPGTARAYGLNAETILNPDMNVMAAVRSIKDLNKSLSKKVPNADERLKFIIAAYNSGLGHIYDAIALAKKTGRNPEVWEGNVSEALLLKSHPQYYNDSVCKYGYFKGKQTTAYVHEVMKTYNHYRQKVPL